MEYVNLGRTGLKVSRLCLGCMSLGVPHQPSALSAPAWTLDEDRAVRSSGGPSRRASTSSTPRICIPRGASEELLGRALKDFAAPRPGRHRDQGLLPDGRRPERPRAVAQAHPGRDRRSPAPARHGLRRPLSDPSLRLRHADRGDPRGAARRRQGGQGALHRRVVHVRVAVRKMLRRRAHGWTRSSRCRTTTTSLYREEEREMLPLCRAEGIGVIPWLPLARGRCPPGNRNARRRSGRAARDKFGKSSMPGHGRRLRGRRDRSVESPRRAACHARRSALAWLLARPAVTAPIIGAAKPRHLRTPSARWRSRSRRKTYRGSRSHTVRTRCWVTNRRRV